MKPTSQIKARIFGDSKAQQFLTNEVYKRMDRYVPYGDTGMLRINVEVGLDTITYKSPYARYQYRGILYVDPEYKKGAFYSENYGFWSRPGVAKIPTSTPLKYSTSGTGSYWDKKMWTAEKDEVLKTLQKYIERGSR